MGQTVQLLGLDEQPDQTVEVRAGGRLQRLLVAFGALGLRYVFHQIAVGVLAGMIAELLPGGVERFVSATELGEQVAAFDIHWRVAGQSDTHALWN
ncbi:MAG: hypothetical protein HY901_15145 [Deltaproteobacteria bacterium]|nr:hypothetical protein [Deltaproteobacteria bacterium]